MPALNNDFTVPSSRLGFFKRIASCCCRLGLLRLAADDEDIFPFLPHCVLLTLLSLPPYLPLFSTSFCLFSSFCVSFFSLPVVVFVLC